MLSSTDSRDTKRELSPDLDTPAEPLPKQQKRSLEAQETKATISSSTNILDIKRGPIPDFNEPANTVQVQTQQIGSQKIQERDTAIVRPALTIQCSQPAQSVNKIGKQPATDQHQTTTVQKQGSHIKQGEETQDKSESSDHPGTTMTGTTPTTLPVLSHSSAAATAGSLSDEAIATLPVLSNDPSTFPPSPMILATCRVTFTPRRAINLVRSASNLPRLLHSDHSARINSVIAHLPADNSYFANVLSAADFASVAPHHWHLIAPRLNGVLNPHINYYHVHGRVPGDDTQVRRRATVLGLFIPQLDSSLTVNPYPWIQAEGPASATSFIGLIREYFRAQLFYFYQIRTLRNEHDRQFATTWWWRHAPARVSTIAVTLPTSSAEFERYVWTLRAQIRDLAESGCPDPSWVVPRVFRGTFRGLDWWSLN
ncbi:hypothetical protein A1O3_04701 [Capronia epimyces CBS 606.96]|uniref:Uncharacterized protein n=1 Tax=Capronia epimyces CBS 606.96 TaxID=1182542 RepID=W9YP44_9EURO|nr:uncharacterized protein A1O3_04701 [Capronia epimyces CBS 606.96]EXJ84034.1 hypothetical protein A1O3_04701 [Capronia epimyces CBS 606.96]